MIWPLTVPFQAPALLKNMSVGWYRQMLDYTRSAVTRNQSEKKINSLLDHVAASTDMRLLQASLQNVLVELSHPWASIVITLKEKASLAKSPRCPTGAGRSRARWYIF